MSDLEKLLEEGDEFERALLGAARDEEEDRAREARTLAALGLGGPVGPTPGAGNTPGPAAAVGKWVALAAVGGAVVAGAIALRSPSQPLPKNPAVLPAVVASVVETPTPSARTQETPEEIPILPQPSRPRIALDKPAPPPKSDPSSLKLEIAALDRARALLKAGDTAGARSELDRYDHDFPFGSLGPEAKALRARVNKKDSSEKKP